MRLLEFHPKLSPENLPVMQNRTLIISIMPRLFLLTFLLGVCLHTKAQSKNDHKCYYSREQAVIDLKKNTAKILIPGGFAPVMYPTDKDFLTNYKIGYYTFGCVAPENIECLTAYNQAIFEHLNKTFGTKWQKEIRKDAIGFARN